MIMASPDASELVVYPTATSLLQDCERSLYADEIDNNQLISLLEIARVSSPGNGPATWFGATKLNGDVRCCAANFEIDGLCLSMSGKGDAADLVERYVDVETAPHRVFGPHDATVHAIEKLTRHIGVSYDVTGYWQAFAIQNATRQLRKAAGRCRPAAKEDLDAVRHFGRLYEEEEPAFISNEEYLVNKLHAGNLWCWDDGEVTSLLAVAGIIRNGFRIAALFTPMPFRGRGYASSLIGAVVEHYLAQGMQYSTVYADANNEKVVHLYESLGFDPIDRKVALSIVE